jgi:hypothetical protein
MMIESLQTKDLRVHCDHPVDNLCPNPSRRAKILVAQDDEAKAGKFGFAVDNTIGGTPQPNGWMDNWIDFFRERRLLHQLRLAGDPKLNELGRRLADNLDRLFEGVEVGPVVLFEIGLGLLFYFTCFSSEKGPISEDCFSSEWGLSLVLYLLGYGRIQHVMILWR